MKKYNSGQAESPPVSHALYLDMLVIFSFSLGNLLVFLYDQLVLKEFDQCENSTLSSFLCNQWKAAVRSATRDRDRHFATSIIPRKASWGEFVSSAFSQDVITGAWRKKGKCFSLRNFCA